MSDDRILKVPRPFPWPAPPPAKSEWISVEERMPEIPHGDVLSGDVLASNGDGYCLVAAWDGKVWSVNKPWGAENWGSDWRDDDVCDITHWMPLPAPPERP